MCLNLQFCYDKDGNPKYNYELTHYLFNRMQKRSSFMQRLNASKKGEITCWKVYDTGNSLKLLQSLWQGQRINKAGVVKSDRASKEFTISEYAGGFVNRGIHVFTTRKKAEKELRWASPSGSNKRFVIVPVICRKSDLIAQGVADDAVFMKVRIEKRTWDKIFSEKK